MQMNQGVQMQFKGRLYVLLQPLRTKQHVRWEAVCNTYKFTNTSPVTQYKTDGRVLSSTMAPNTMFSFQLAMCIIYTHTSIVITSVSNYSYPFRSEFCPYRYSSLHIQVFIYAHRLTVVSYRTQSQTIPAQLAATLQERKTCCHSLAGIHQRHYLWGTDQDLTCQWENIEIHYQV